MTAVKERRALRTKAAVKTYSTGTGIFSNYFASEYILRDIVKDSTINIMHVFLCGMTRYCFLVADGFAHPPRLHVGRIERVQGGLPMGARRVRVPTLERSKGDKSRASC